MPAVLHEAGQLVDQVQRCVRCGQVLSDYRNTSFVGPAPRGWPPGPVTRDGRVTGTGVHGDPMPCRGKP